VANEPFNFFNEQILEHFKIKALVLHVYRQNFLIKRESIKYYVYPEKGNEKWFMEKMKMLKAFDKIKILNANLIDNKIYLNPLSIVEITEKAKFLKLHELFANGNDLRKFVNVCGFLRFVDGNKMEKVLHDGKREVKIKGNYRIDVEDNTFVYISDIFFDKACLIIKPETRFFVKKQNVGLPGFEPGLLPPEGSGLPNYPTTPKK
jgi:hypothetical protein